MMAYGLKALRKLQLFKETVKGTAGPATVVWRGVGVLKDLTPHVFAEEDVGYMSGVDRTYNPYFLTELSLAPVPATFEQLPYLLEAGIKKLGTGVADGGGGSGKIYTYPLPTTGTNDILTYTIEGGNNNEKEEASYFIVEEIKLSGKPKSAITMSAKLSGRQATVLEYTASTIAFVQATKKITDSALLMAQFVTGTTIKVTGTVSNDGIYTVATGGVAAEIVVTETLVDESAGSAFTLQDWFAGGPTGLALPTVEEMIFGKSKLYIDAIAGTIGTTPKAATLLGWDLGIKTGWRGVFSGDGNASFGYAKCANPELTLDITFEHEGSCRAEKAIWRAKTARLIRVLVEGSALGTVGSVYTYKTLRINMAGKWMSFDQLDEQDGNDIVTGTFVSRYVPAALAPQFASIIVVNEVAAL